ncbi:MAG TPA: hypothetical protein VLN26_04470 [Gaiellaceae bacterium]|nr:hypothetical protein [Gaiellaceae bacterium]
MIVCREPDAAAAPDSPKARPRLDDARLAAARERLRRVLQGVLDELA